jgi:delta 1-pyrroline-5-carboxylate dehydrogenase
MTTVTAGAATDFDGAVAAAAPALGAWRATPAAERAEILLRLADAPPPPTNPRACVSAPRHAAKTGTTRTFAPLDSTRKAVPCPLIPARRY